MYNKFKPAELLHYYKHISLGNSKESAIEEVIQYIFELKEFPQYAKDDMDLVINCLNQYVFKNIEVFDNDYLYKKEFDKKYFEEYGNKIKEIYSKYELYDNILNAVSSFHDVKVMSDYAFFVSNVMFNNPDALDSLPFAFIGPKRMSKHLIYFDVILNRMGIHLGSIVDGNILPCDILKERYNKIIDDYKDNNMLYRYSRVVRFIQDLPNTYPSLFKENINESYKSIEKRLKLFKDEVVAKKILYHVYNENPHFFSDISIPNNN